MKELFKFLLAFASCVAIIYLASSVLLANFDVLAWDYESRKTFVIVSLFIGIVFGSFACEE